MNKVTQRYADHRKRESAKESVIQASPVCECLTNVRLVGA